LKARNKYKLADEFFNTKEGYITFPDIYLVRLFVESINGKKDLLHFPELAVRASEINGIGLINEISHNIFRQFKEEVKPDLYKSLLSELKVDIDQEDLKNEMKAFLEEFPNQNIYSGEVDVEVYLEETTEGRPNQEIILEEMIHLWLNNNNPSFSKHLEFFDDADLEKTSNYREIMEKMEQFFTKQELFGPENLPLIQSIQKPVSEHPYSIKDQLEYMTKNWGAFLDSTTYYRLLYALDLFAEEEKMRGLGPGEAQAIDYGDGLEERYTPDKDWMPNVVMIAKTTYVWLDQLSKKYNREIRHLDQIPIEELDQLASWGFNALWLIGLWERSPASKTVKHWCGNPEAEASAYSLFDYVIAQDLGGEKAFQILKEQAQSRGIRLASDMVPNHTGIDSKWLREHPEWYVSLDYSPFPSYSYSGESLSGDPNFGIYLEDHYFSRSDAAVTFKRVDFRTNGTKFIYHGNDGTSMPWNDTAQLNYLLKDVREAVIQTILHVARKFSIIRFDAAMTLTKKHFQRLWFPTPGSGGDIPSRAGMGLTQDEFHKAFPQEFWREVVDRINEKMPDTLLLAEAFWLLEGFFVRTLGMHRVYNSAFMNMLRDEDNAKYRSVIKNTLEFDPQILKRFVNFMNNPDEETAVKQFGKGEKYFGICLLLVTLPGLPMFGHGMIEGFSEKYGMEYRKAYWDEEVDWGLLQHHERVIFPLVNNRYLFSNVDNFYLYDLYTTDGYVDENVFCYSNGTETERSLIIYNNNFNGTAGWIKTSSAKLNKSTEVLQQQVLGEGILLTNEPANYWLFRNQFTNLEYIRHSSEIFDKGFYVILNGYQSMALINFREVADNEWKHYSHLNNFLGGRGVPNIEEAKLELIYEPLLNALRSVFNSELILPLYKAIMLSDFKDVSKIIGNASENYKELYIQVATYTNDNLIVAERKQIGENSYSRILKDLLSLKRVYTKDMNFPNEMSDFILQNADDFSIAYAWILLKDFGSIGREEDYSIKSRTRIDQWHVGHVLRDQLSTFQGVTSDDADYDINLVKILIRHQYWFKDKKLTNAGKILRLLLANPEIHDFLNINRFQDVLWFSSDNFEKFIGYLGLIALVDILSADFDEDKTELEVKRIHETIFNWINASKQSNYQVEKLLSYL
jgi:hypothetical protein